MISILRSTQHYRNIINVGKISLFWELGIFLDFFTNKNLCVDDTGLGPAEAVRFSGPWKPVSCISGIFEFCSATLVIFYFLIERGDYRVIL